MRLTNMHCDGCDRQPTFWEWFRGELTAGGYPDWRHPGIIFKAHELPLTLENQNKAARVYEALFGRPMPEDLSYLCPECQTRADMRLSELIAKDPGEAPPSTTPQAQPHRQYMGTPQE